MPNGFCAWYPKIGVGGCVGEGGGLHYFSVSPRPLGSFLGLGWGLETKGLGPGLLDLSN